MKTKIKAVVFDAGGVITEWRKPLTRFFTEIDVTVEEWVAAIEPDEEIANKGLLEPDECFKRIMKRLDREDQWLRLREVSPGSFERIEETFALLEELQDRFRLALLTNALSGSVDQLDRKVKLKKYFEVIIDSSAVGMVKPDKRIFLLTCQRLGLKPQQCLFIDDDEKNIKAAQKLGFQTVHFTEPKTGVEEIKEKLGLE